MVAVFENVAQGSDVWKEARKKRIGGSEIASIIGISPYVSAYQLWMEKTGIKEREDISRMPHVVRGINGEKVARMLIEKQTLKSFNPQVWKIEGTPLGASDDGHSHELNTILEIKCQGAKAHEATKNGVIPNYYMCQCVWNLGVSGADECWFISFRPEDGTMHKVVVYPDPVEFERLKTAALEFWELVSTRVPPSLSEGDYVDLNSDYGLKALAEEYARLKGEVAAKQDRLDELETRLKDVMGNNPGVRIGPLKMTQYTRRGTIDYARIADVSKMSAEELESYRRPSSVGVRFTLGVL
jgi:putative phage-type endonuclease